MKLCTLFALACRLINNMDDIEKKPNDHQELVSKIILEEPDQDEMLLKELADGIVGNIRTFQSKNEPNEK